jgi:hypothetical protein
MPAARKKFKTMEPYIMRPPLEFQQNLMYEHAGQEFVFVLRGSVEVEFSGKKVVLNERTPLISTRTFLIGRDPCGKKSLKSWSW